MTFTRPVLVIMHGSTGDGDAERMMAHARVAAAKAAALVAVRSGFEAAIVATDQPDAFSGEPASFLIDADEPGRGFRIDERLREIIERFGLERPVVMGSGAAPMLQASEWRRIAAELAGPGERLVTNNFFSGDVTGWAPGSAISRLGPFERDNQLPRRLRDEAGLIPVTLPRTTGTTFDLDTPADLTVLSLQEAPPGAIDIEDGARALPVERYRQVMPFLCDPKAELVVAGRVGSQAWQYLERETACRVRMFSEERGMAAAGASHVPRALLGYMVEDVGYAEFFRRMAELGDALVLDTRVLEAHLGLSPSREDRYQSDLYRPDAIGEPGLRALTEAAMDAPLPVLLGGHSLVSGGLMALNDAAWTAHDRTRNARS